MSDAWMTAVSVGGFGCSVALTIYTAYDGCPWWFTGVVALVAAGFAGLWTVNLVRWRRQRARAKAFEELRAMAMWLSSMGIQMPSWDEIEAMQRRRRNDG